MHITARGTTEIEPEAWTEKINGRIGPGQCRQSSLHIPSIFACCPLRRRQNPSRPRTLLLRSLLSRGLHLFQASHRHLVEDRLLPLLLPCPDQLPLRRPLLRRPYRITPLQITHLRLLPPMSMYRQGTHPPLRHVHHVHLLLGGCIHHRIQSQHPHAPSMRPPRPMYHQLRSRLLQCTPMVTLLLTSCSQLPR